MKISKETLLSQAREICRDIYSHTLGLKQSIIEKADRALFDTEVPEIIDFLIFGSLGKGGESAHDIDIMAIENGYFSENYVELLKVTGYDRCKGDETDLEEVYQILFQKTIPTEIKSISCDLVFLPEKFFVKRNYREMIKFYHRDPFFFNNVFEQFLLYPYPQVDCLIKENLSYFKLKYNADLSDLEKVSWWKRVQALPLKHIR